MVDKLNIPPSEPYFSSEDIEIILEDFKNILRGDGLLSMSAHGERFEDKYSRYVGTNYAVATNSGTSAIELILRAVGVEGTEVIIPSNTFIATAISVLNAGGEIVFADCNDEMCLDYEDVVNKITPKTSVIIQVHIGGIVSSSTQDLINFATENGIKLVEDAAQSHGSSLEGKMAGSFGIAAAFSFFSTKIMTTGEGGMVTTNSRMLYEKMLSLREFGKVKHGIYQNYHTALGFNGRMPEVSALMGLRQLEFIEENINRRRKIASIYDEYLCDVKEIGFIRQRSARHYNYFKYIVDLKGRNRSKIHKGMVNNGVTPSGYVYEIPLHKQPVFQESHSAKLPRTEYFSKNHFCLPIYFSLADSEVRLIATRFRKLLYG
jgi:dTDP-4-amino-4,6-dideoxygalactose transaminase